MDNVKIVPLRDAPHLTEAAAEWFHKKWRVPLSTYLASIRQCQAQRDKVPQWFLAMEGSEIVGGIGVIDNDFHNRKDVTPNVCAVYVEESHRYRGIARRMLDCVLEDAARMKIPALFILTDHTEFYEKCGWTYVFNIKDKCGESARVYKHICTLPDDAVST